MDDACVRQEIPNKITIHPHTRYPCYKKYFTGSMVKVSLVKITMFSRLEYVNC